MTSLEDNLNNMIKQRVTATYTLQVAPADEKAAACVLTTAGIAYTQTKHGLVLTATYAPQALASLLSDHVTIAHYDRDEADLESVFLSVTQQETSHANH